MSKAMLFVPASEERKLEKILTLDAPAFLIDLEDGVAPSQKASARNLLEQLASKLYSQKSCWVRVNALDTEHFYSDVQAALKPGLLGINIPKVEDSVQLQIADWYLSQLERTNAVQIGSVKLMATLETSKGVERAFEIATSTPRLKALCFGAADYSRDLRLDWPAPEPYPAVTAAKVRLVQASAAAGLEAPHDGASAEFKDLARLEEETKAAKTFGFGGKHAIHPAQIPIILQVFRPSEKQVDWAERVLAYHNEHPEQGAFQLDGRMVDAPVIARARQILEDAR